MFSKCFQRVNFLHNCNGYNHRNNSLYLIIHWSDSNNYTIMGLAGKEFHLPNIVYILAFCFHLHFFIFDYLKMSPSPFSQRPYSGDKVWRGHVIAILFANHFFLCQWLLCSSVITVTSMAVILQFSSIRWKHLAFLKAFIVSKHCPFIDARVILATTLGNSHV